MIVSIVWIVPFVFSHPGEHGVDHSPDRAVGRLQRFHTVLTCSGCSIDVCMLMSVNVWVHRYGSPSGRYSDRHDKQAKDADGQKKNLPRTETKLPRQHKIVLCACTRRLQDSERDNGRFSRTCQAIERRFDTAHVQHVALSLTCLLRLVIVRLLQERKRDNKNGEQGMTKQSMDVIIISFLNILTQFHRFHRINQHTWPLAICLRRSAASWSSLSLARNNCLS